MASSGPSSSSAGGGGSGGGVSGDSDTGIRNLPKDGHVMVAILKDMGITEYEPRVINQLLEFSYRYVCTILEDSKIISSHAKKKSIDIDDIKLSIQMFTEQNFTTPPSRDILLETARIKNSTALPVPKPSSGAMKLPPDRYCLTACNYRLKNKSKSTTNSKSKNNYTSYYQQPPKININPNPLPYGKKVAISTTPGVTGNVNLSNNIIKINPGTPPFKITPGNPTSNAPVFKIQMQPGIQLNAGAGGANNKRKRDDEEN